jgi:hypothetical protein
MAVEITTLDTISQEAVDQAFTYLTGLLLERYPNLEVRRGVIGDLVLRLHAISYGAIKENIDRLQQSASLKAIGDDPTLADTDIVDAVLSNYRVVRKDPAFAAGEVTIVLEQQLSVTVAAGASFLANGQTYQTTDAFTARLSAANVLSSTDRLLQQIATGRYAFTVSVKADVAGAASQAKKGDKFVPELAPTGFVQAYAASDFSAGTAIETNAELLNRLQLGAASRAFSNRLTTAAMILNSPDSGHSLANSAFANIVAISLVGFGDPEMQRDQHWLLPTSGGGRVDAYVRTQPLYNHVSQTVTATLIEKRADGSLWQFSLTRDKVPGAYEVTGVLLPTDDQTETGFEVLETIRSIDLTGDIYIPDIETAQEGVFSRYQTLTVRFLDTATNVSSLTVNEATQEYSATLAVMPLVAELQAYLSDRGVTDPAGDVLVKAAIPCFLSLSFTLQRRRTTATVDTDAITGDLVDYVNQTGFVGKLYASDLINVIAPHLPSSISVGNVQMFGRIVSPDGTTRYVRSDEVLTIPDVAAAFLSGRTCVFLLAATDVAISDDAVEVPEV